MDENDWMVQKIDVLGEVHVLTGMLEHIHADLRALRAHLGIDRPECYPETSPEDGRAERAEEE